MRKWIPIVILGSAQFVMVLDSSVMNVSISQIVDDLDTTIQGVQLAITAYTLVMAAFMLVGAKLGDIWGRGRTFAPRLDVFGAAISAAGLALAVLGILGSSSWGWIEPKDAPVLFGHEITPFGFSVVPFLIAAGLVLLAGFVMWEERRERLGRDVLL